MRKNGSGCISRVLTGIIVSICLAGNADAQKKITSVIDNKGSIKKVLDSASSLLDSAHNGLHLKDNSKVALGGALIETTVINTSSNEDTKGNVLEISIGKHDGDSMRITGLKSGKLETDSIVVVNGGTGRLGYVEVSQLVQSGEYTDTIRNAIQPYTFDPAGFPKTVSKLWVYRNGAKLSAGDYFTNDAGKIGLSTEMGKLISPGDIINIQWVK